MTGLLRSRVLNLLIALAFFAAAGAFVASALWPVAGGQAGATAGSSSMRGAAPAPSSADRSSARSAGAPAASGGEARQRGPVADLVRWINATFGLHQVSEDAKRTLSLVFSGIGTLFTIRTYLLNRRRVRLMEERLAGGRRA